MVVESTRKKMSEDIEEHFSNIFSKITADGKLCEMLNEALNKFVAEASYDEIEKEWEHYTY